ncbi:MAG TPA: vanadium-dependent haloperoxidase [Chitinophagaceae bacterium]|nr:vanadium-dependent haloperoxidase [Chitinophagaceae bacterium]
MKTTFNLSLIKKITIVVITIYVFSSCQKEIDKKATQPEEFPTAANQSQGHLQQTKTFSAEVAQKWQDLQLRFLQLPTTTNPYGRHGHRWFAYCGIALYESVVPGMPAYQSLYGQLTEMPQMPSTYPGSAYHWPTCANAALAYMNKHFFTLANTSAINVATMDSLENALNSEYQSEVNAETFQRSKDFGRIVAERIFNWSTTDGSLAVNPPYVMASLPLWQPTAPNPTAVADPYWGNNRSFVQGSMNGTASPLPPTYSTDPNSAYYAMVKEVYDVSQTLTPEQIATALYFRDNPGFPNATNYISTFSQIMHIENPQLDFYALAHAKTGIAFAEAMINCWKIKYTVLQDRPTRFIRDVLGHTTWSPLISTPPHPEFPSAHSQMAGAVSTVLTSLLGDNYHFTLHTYDYLGMAPRTYNSFDDMAVDVGKARVYAGIHYTYSCVEGRKQGGRIAQNVLNILKFEKE